MRRPPKTEAQRALLDAMAAPGALLFGIEVRGPDGSVLFTTHPSTREWLRAYGWLRATAYGEGYPPRTYRRAA